MVKKNMCGIIWKENINTRITLTSAMLLPSSVINLHIQKFIPTGQVKGMFVTISKHLVNSNTKEMTQSIDKICK